METVKEESTIGRELMKRVFSIAFLLVTLASCSAVSSSVLLAQLPKMIDHQCYSLAAGNPWREHQCTDPGGCTGRLTKCLQGGVTVQYMHADNFVEKTYDQCRRNTGFDCEFVGGNIACITYGVYSAGGCNPADYECAGTVMKPDCR